MNRELFVSKNGFSPFLRLVATVLIPAQLLSIWPAPALLLAVETAADKPATPLAQPHKQLTELATPVPVKVNRTVPTVAKEAKPLTFSANPSDDEFRTVRLFAEPLLPIGEAKSTPEENSALAQVILAFASDPTPENSAPLKGFLASHPKSVWRVALLTNLGLIQRGGAYWSEAMASWQEAWKLGKDEKESTRRMVVDRALAQLAELLARLGRKSDLEALLVETGKRDVRGPAMEKLAEARQSLHVETTEPTKSFRCGPLAIGRIYHSQHPELPMPAEVHNSVSTDHGTSMPQVQQFARTLGMDYQMAFRSPGAQVIVPSVVNWKVGHYAAITKQIDDRFLIEDTTFSAKFVASRKALDQEGSGYFLVPAGALPEGWRSVEAEEGGKVWGKGGGGPAEPSDPKCYSCGLTGGPCPPNDDGDDDCPGMPGYRVDAARIGLLLTDTPLSYRPPRGPAIKATVNYLQRDVAPTSSPNYTNLGTHWNLDWVCFVVDDPSNVNTSTYGPGGGTLTYAGYTSTGATTGAFGLQGLSHAVLQRTSATSYVATYPSGAKQIFGLADNSSPKRVYLTEYDDPAGNKVTYTYDAVTYRLTAVTDALGQVSTLSYVSDIPAAPNGDYYRLAQVTDPFGRTALFSYNGSGQLAQITDSAGLSSSFTYGTGDFITTLTTPYGDTTFVSSDVGSDRSLLITDPEGGQEYFLFKYDMAAPDAGAAAPSAAGLLINTTYQNFRTTYHWDKKAYADAPGDYSKAHLIHWLHTPDGSAASNIPESEKMAYESRVYYNYAGQTTAYLASTQGDLVTKIARVLDDGSTQLSQYDYNALGKRTKAVTPGNGTTPSRTTTWKYAANGVDVVAVYQQNAAGASTDAFSVAADLLSSFTYDAGGKHLVVSATDAAGQTTAFTYNSFGQTLTVTDPLSHTTTFAYDRDDDSDSVTDGYLTSITGPVAGATAQFQYDGFGRLWKITNSDSDTVTLAYDAIGGVSTKTLNRLAATTYPDGTTSQILYDRLDPQWRQDRLGRWTQLFHDKLRHLSAVLDPLGRLTQYQWCRCGALEAIIDPAGNQTTWIRDEQSRVVNKIYPDNSVVTYNYEDRTSRLRSVLDAKGQRTNHQYNIDGSLAQASYTNASGAALSPPTPAVSYTYDTAYGRMATMVDGIGTTQYAYNSITAPPALGAGRLATVDGPWANDTIGYTYDGLGRIVGRTIDGANNSSSFGYDTLGRLHTTTNPLGAFTYNYVGVTGRLDNVAYPNGQATQYAYYGAGGSRRLQQIKNLDAAAATISQFDYTYNAMGDILTWTQNNSGLTNPRQYAFGYDAVDQLTSATLSDAVTHAPVREQAYRYDAAGNRVTTQDGNTITTETANDLNQLSKVDGGGMMRFTGTLSKPATVTVGGSAAQMNGSNTQFEGHAQVSASTTTAVHIVATDGDGVVTDKHVNITPDSVAGQAFAYDLNGNTTSSGPAGAPTVTYGWDAADRLVSVAQGANVTTFEYDGLSRRVREKLNGAEIRHWVWDGLGLSEERDSINNVTKRFYGQGEQIAGTSYYFTRDHLGSVEELLDSTGRLGTGLVARYNYNLYGKRSANLVTLGSIESDFGFTGHQEFSNLNLIGAMLRFYQPVAGRWLSRDPIREAGGANLYAYANNSPTNFIDMLGEAPLPWPEPPSSIPNGPWKFIPDPQNSRGGSMRPINPPTGQSQPTLSWSDPTNNLGDGNPEGYWKYSDGKGNTQRYNREGAPISPSEAHPGRPGSGSPSCPPKSPPEPEPTPWRDFLNNMLELFDGLLRAPFFYNPYMMPPGYGPDISGRAPLYADSGSFDNSGEGGKSPGKKRDAAARSINRGRVTISKKALACGVNKVECKKEVMQTDRNGSELPTRKSPK